MAADRSVDEDQRGAAGRRTRGEFVRGVSEFRGVLGSEAFPAEAGRYHLFVALNCRWCHRVTLARGILGLEATVSMDVAFPNRTSEDDPEGPNFWEFAPDRVATLTAATLAECTEETGTGQGYRLVRQIYEAEGSAEKSVPVLYDKIARRIVNNESAEIVRMLDACAEALGSNFAERPRLYPAALETEIDGLNELIYVAINNGAL